MAKTYSLTQLVQEANARLAQEGLEPSMNERLVRHYTSEKKVLPPPDKEGREARYYDSHLEKLVTLRRAQKLGITANALDSALKYSSSIPDVLDMASNPNTGVLRVTGSILSASAAAQSHNLVGASTAYAAVSPQVNSVSSSAAQESALSFLKSLDPKDKDEALLGQVSKMTRTPTAPLNAMIPEQLISWEVLPGLKLLMRADVYSNFGAEEERVVIDAIKNIRKSKP